MSEKTNLYDTYVDQLHQSAAAGDVAAIRENLKVVPDVNAANARGWTALMFAARNGHQNVTKELIEKGADVNMTNSLGQTAKDIAEFWQNQGVLQILLKASEGSQPLMAGLPVGVTRSNFFCDSPLDRSSQRRTDKEYLEKLKSDPKTVYVLFTQLQPLVKSNSMPSGYGLVRFSIEKAKQFLDSDAVVIFLGIEKVSSNSEGNVEKDVSVGWFAIDCGNLTEEKINELEVDSVLLPLPFGIMQLSRPEAAIFAQARSVLAWHERYKFCSTCGSPTTMEDAGYKRTCVSKDCASQKGVHNTSYPRTDPTVIMAVMSPDRSQILLGRPKRYRASMYSCLAGFMEPGESIEEACRREVHEESGVKVGRVDYHSCQPWPMPSSLMIGCIAQAETTEIKVDKEELEDARWFGPAEVRPMLMHQHPEGLFCPPEQAIAHQLIKYWLNHMCKL